LVGREYKIGEQRYLETGLRDLANRLRQRLFFILAADEILNKLASNERHLDLRFGEGSGALYGHLYVKDDEVRSLPPLLLTFVVGIQASRVRRCITCDKYFWAGPKRQDRLLAELWCNGPKATAEEARLGQKTWSKERAKA